MMENLYDLYLDAFMRLDQTADKSRSDFLKEKVHIWECPQLKVFRNNGYTFVLL
jgi:hypothetical protein